MKRETINLISDLCKPLVNSGLLSAEEYKNAIYRLKEQPKKQNSEPELITRKKVQHLLKISLRTVDRLADEGYLQRVKIGKRSIRFLKSDVHQLMENREVLSST